MYGGVNLEAERKCGNNECDKILLPGEEKKCSRCLVSFYCSKECFEVAWKSTHKHECRGSQQAVSQRTWKMNDPVEAVVAKLHRAIVINDITAACVNVMTLAQSNESIVKKMGACGTCEIVIEKLTTFPNECEVVKFCIAVIAALSYGDVKNAEDNRVMFINRGTIRLIASAMALFVSDWQISYQGNAAIAGLSTSTFNKSKVKKHGGCQAIIAAMNAHPHNEMVQGTGLLEICKLTTDFDIEKTKSGDIAIKSESSLAETRSLFPTLGAFEIVMNAMQAHPKNTNIVERGIKACILLFYVESNKNRYDVVDFIGTVIRSNISNFEAAGLWVRAVAQVFASTVAAAERLGETGACEMLVVVIRQHARRMIHVDSPMPHVMLPLVTKALLQLTHCPTNCLKLAKAGTCKLIRDILDMHHWDYNIARDCFDLVVRMTSSAGLETDQQQHIMAQFVTADVLSVLCMAQHKHAHDVENTVDFETAITILRLTGP